MIPAGWSTTAELLVDGKPVGAARLPHGGTADIGSELADTPTTTFTVTLYGRHHFKPPTCTLHIGGSDVALLDRSSTR